jgi:hypothetical protein
MNADGEYFDQSSGWAKCEHIPDTRNVVRTENVCRPPKYTRADQQGGGLVAINEWYPASGPQVSSKWWIYNVVHEFGHVLGLGHPFTNCNNSCVGPVMSYGSCPYVNGTDCGWAGVPNEDDRAGIRKAYYGTSDYQAGCTPKLPSPYDVSLDSGALLDDGSAAEGGGLGNAADLDDGVTVPGITLSDLDFPAPDSAGAVRLVPGEPRSLLGDPTGVAFDQLKLLQLLAEPAVDAYATLIATAGKGWKTVEVVLDDAGLPDLDGECL